MSVRPIQKIEENNDHKKYEGHNTLNNKLILLGLGLK